MTIRLFILLHVNIFLFLFIEKIRTLLILALLGVGSNILQATSKTVSKGKYRDPDALIEVSENILIINLLSFNATYIHI